MKNIKYIELSQNQIDFLKNYTPETKGFTSGLEMKNIISKFELKNLSFEEIQALRNSVVRFYSDLHRGLLIGGTEKQLDNIMEAMQSITAVIDHQICQTY